jgi:protein phosphatase
MVWELSAAAATLAKGPVNDDAVGVNGWALTGLRPELWTTRHTVSQPEAFVVADGLQVGYGGLGAQLVAREASRPDAVRDRAAVVASLARLDAELLADDYFSAHWDITPDRLRLPGATVAGCRVDPADQTAQLLLFNVGDAGVFVVLDGRLAKQSIDDRAESGMLTQCVGGGPPGAVNPHVVPFMLGNPTRVLLCSDGLTDAVDYGAVNQAVCSAPAPRAAVAGLLAAAAATGLEDDATAVVLDIARERPPSPAARGRGWRR